MTVGNRTALGYAIAIGINQYEQFQPLNYALRDAQAVQMFLTTEAKFSPDRVLLLTDNSPLVEQGSTIPNRANLEAALRHMARQPQANDVLWVFFSGYGVQVDGQDYVMPIDGDPKRVRETGLAIETVYSILQTAKTRNILVLLDMNRIQSATAADARVSEQTAAIAAQTGITTILSCQSDQFADETLALRHGLFTAALMEGLRYGNCTTIDHLVQFLATRLPELTQHHWRPRQDPLAIVASQQRYQLLLPSRQQAPDLDATPDNGKQAVPAAAAIGNGYATASPSPITMPVAIATGLPDPVPPPSSSTAIVPVSQSQGGFQDDDSHFWRLLLALGGLLFALLVLGVLFQNRGELTEAPTPTTPSPDRAIAVDSPSPTPTATAPSPTATATPPTVDPPVPIAPATPTGGGSGAGAPSLTRPPDVAVAPATTQSSALNAVRAALDQSIATSPATSISAFSRAIQQAQQIPQSDPGYAQAQQDIDRWGLLILRAAEQRANQSNGGSRRRAAQNYRAAIAAAQLVPRDRPALYTRAQQLIAFCNRQLQ